MVRAGARHLTSLSTFAWALSAVSAFAIDAAEMDKAIEKRLCPAPPALVSFVTFQEFCGEGYQKTMNNVEVVQCQIQTERLNNKIHKYNEFVRSCSNYRAAHGGSQQKSLATRPVQSGGGTDVSADLAKEIEEARKAALGSDAKVRSELNTLNSEHADALTAARDRDEGLAEAWRKYYRDLAAHNARRAAIAEQLANQAAAASTINVIGPPRQYLVPTNRYRAPVNRYVSPSQPYRQPTPSYRPAPSANAPTGSAGFQTQPSSGGGGFNCRPGESIARCTHR